MGQRDPRQTKIYLTEEEVQAQRDAENAGLGGIFRQDKTVAYDPNTQQYQWGRSPDAAELERRFARGRGEQAQAQAQGIVDPAQFAQQRQQAQALGARAADTSQRLQNLNLDFGGRADMLGRTGATEAMGAAGASYARGAPTLQRTDMGTQTARTVGQTAGGIAGTAGAGAQRANIQGSTAARAATPIIDTAAARAAREQQMGSALGFGQFAEQGPGPSAAEAQLRAGQDRAAASAIALARSGRGAGANAAAARDAMFANAAGNQQLNQQMAQLRAQEEAAWRGQQLQAMSGQQQALTGARGQDIQLAQTLGAQGLESARLQGDLGLRSAELQGGLGMQAAGLQGQLGMQAAGMDQQQNALQAQLTADQRQRNQDRELALRGQALGYTQMAATTPAQYFALQNQAAGMGLGAQQAALGAQMGSLQTQTGAQLGALNAGTAAQMGWEGIGQDVMRQQMQADMAEEELRAQNVMQARQIAAEADAQRDAAYAQMASSGIAALGGLFAMSDREVKTEIKPAEVVSDVASLAEALGAPPANDALEVAAGSPTYSYRYKQKKHGDGEYVGPMAQDLAKTAAGRSVVLPTPEGLAVDTRRLTMVNTSALGELARKVEALEASGRAA